jgi:AcrR family transcriptional regulator
VSGRAKQRARTRQAIVRAAGELLKRRGRPSLEEIAEQAQVSRATAYRYFPRLDLLLSEAAVDVLMPEPASVFQGAGPSDPAERLHWVDEAIDNACREQEAALRLMLARQLERSIGRKDDDPPLRQNRRAPLIEQALAPLAPRLGEARLSRLSKALAMIVGTEGFIATTDVLGLDREEAREVRRWAIEALVEGALNESPSTG